MPSTPIKRFIEKHKKAKTGLLLVALFGACMVISVGVLTPAISGKGTFFHCMFMCIVFLNFSFELLLAVLVITACLCVPFVVHLC